MRHNVDVAKAVKNLIKIVGTACGGDAGQFHTQIGRTITQSFTTYVASENVNALGKHIPGGYVEISLQGSEQPEAARVLDNIIGRALKDADITKEEWSANEKGNRRYPKYDPHTMKQSGRIIKFMIPDSKAAAFADALDEIGQIISKSGSLSQQCHKGVLCSQDVINQVEGLTTNGEIKKGAIKPFVELCIPARDEAASSGLAKQAYFTLHLEGVPNGMAEAISKIQNIPSHAYAESKERNSRDMEHKFTGGVDISIPINDSRFDEVMDAIENYKPPHAKRGDSSVAGHYKA